MGVGTGAYGGSVPRALLRSLMFPSNKNSFRHGHVDDRLRVWAEVHYKAEEIERWIHKLQPLFVEAYKRIWDGFTDAMAEKGVNFAQRLKKVYGQSPSQMKDGPPPLATDRAEIRVQGEPARTDE